MDGSDWLAWQLADSAYPAGGFVHSAGVEAAARQGFVRGRDDLEGALRDVLVGAANAVLPFAEYAWRRPGAFGDIDEACDATLLNPVAHRASTEQGRAMLAATARVFEHDDIARLEERCRAGESVGHFAVVFGALCAHLGVGVETMRRLLLYQLARTVVSSAIRLGVVGPIEGQKLIARAGELAKRLANEVGGGDVSEVCQTTPMLDLAQSCHDRAYTRLFRS